MEPYEHMIQSDQNEDEKDQPVKVKNTLLGFDRYGTLTFNDVMILHHENPSLFKSTVLFPEQKQPKFKPVESEKKTG
jgi:hypothetical protein